MPMNFLKVRIFLHTIITGCVTKTRLLLLSGVSYLSFGCTLCVPHCFSFCFTCCSKENKLSKRGFLSVSLQPVQLQVKRFGTNWISLKVLYCVLASFQLLVLANWLVVWQFWSGANIYLFLFGSSGIYVAHCGWLTELLWRHVDHLLNIANIVVKIHDLDVLNSYHLSTPGRIHSR